MRRNMVLQGKWPPVATQGFVLTGRAEEATTVAHRAALLLEGEVEVA